MRLFIAVIKLLLICISTVFFYVIITICLLPSIIGLKGNRWSPYFLSIWGRVVCKIIGLTITVKGDAPKPPYFLISNHLSYIDIFLLISCTPSVFIAKSEVLSWPLFGFMSKTVGMLFIDRNKKKDVKRVNKLISERISDTQGILLFPEGTTSKGSSILPFKASLLAYPAEVGIPVHYVTIHYSTSESEPHASESVCWWRDETFIAHFIELLKLKSISGTLYFGDKPVTNSNRKELAKDLHERVTKEFVPITDDLATKS
ncbi:MAG: 1-acyl-sn-glycerol-3-phosphate acyltransferase [Balneola sp.]